MAMENPFAESNKHRMVNYFKKLTPLSNHVIVRDMNFSGRTLSSGVILLGDDGKTDGIRPRWSKVYAIGPQQTDVVPDQWIMVEHGRWTRGIEVDINGDRMTLRRVDPDAIMLVSDEEPQDDVISTSVHAERKERENYSD